MNVQIPMWDLLIHIDGTSNRRARWSLCGIFYKAQAPSLRIGCPTKEPATCLECVVENLGKPNR